MAFLVATTSLPAVYRPNGYARTKTAGTPHARANIWLTQAYVLGTQTLVFQIFDIVSNSFNFLILIWGEFLYYHPFHNISYKEVVDL